MGILEIIGAALASILMGIGGRWLGRRQGRGEGRKEIEDELVQDYADTRKRMDEADALDDSPDAILGRLRERNQRRGL